MNKLQKKYIREYYNAVCEKKAHSSIYLTDCECKRIIRERRSIENLERENITIDKDHDNGIYLWFNNEIVAKILNQYSTRKIELCYKELKPKLVFV